MTALVLGIVSFVGAFIPVLDWATIFLALVGLILGIVGLVQKFRPKRIATIGTIISGVALILSIVMVVVYTAVLFSAISSTSDQMGKVANANHTVVLSVTASNTKPDISYTDDAGSSSDDNNATVPWTKTATVKAGTIDVHAISVIATAGDSAKSVVTCTIKVDGDVRVTKTSKGAFASADCDLTNINKD